MLVIGSRCLFVVFFPLILGVVDDKMSVLLYDTTGAQDVCINEFLVHNGYCQTAGLGYACHTITQNVCHTITQCMSHSNTECMSHNSTEWLTRLAKV